MREIRAPMRDNRSYIPISRAKFVTSARQTLR